MPEETVWPAELFLDLDRTGPVPLFFQVSSRLESAIRGGVIAPGARLENEISIAQRLGVSRPTIRRAIQDLVDKGLLVRRRGIGTQVVQGQVTRPMELTSLFEDLTSARHQAGTRVLERAVVPAPSTVAAQLGIETGADVVHLRRVRSADGVPVAVLENFLPAHFEEVLRDHLEDRGMYQILRSSGVAISVANQRISARRARGDESDLLDIEVGGPVLTMERIAFDNSGRAIELGQHCYRPDRYTFESTLVAK